jgi:hypothetical protein
MLTGLRPSGSHRCREILPVNINDFKTAGLAVVSVRKT